MMQKNTMGDLIYFTSPQLSEQKELKHLFTSRLGGVSKGHLSSLNLGFSLGDNRENVIKNYEKICLALKVPLSSVVPSKQVHGDAVYVVCKEDAGVFPPDPERPGCDSLITQEKGITLAGFYADCSVALFYDAKQKAIGVAHSGWRGTALSIYKKTVLAMHANFNTNPRDILVSFAPSIGPCCFETDSDVPEALYYALTQKINPFIKKVGQKWRIDLVGINRMILQDAGILGEHIVDSGHCTGCEPEFFWSHRKTGGQRGVSAAFISMQ